MSSRIYVLRQEQWVPQPIDDVFAFFSDAHNLEAITPPWLGFKVLSMSTDGIEEGTKIEYRLNLHGVSMKWRTEIRRWDRPHSFIDFQESGPYKLWHHTHRFEAHGERTKMVDVVRYTLPFGVLGRVVHKLKVRDDVCRIFEYRRQRIEEVFGLINRIREIA